jgi:hypothetical protein
MRALCLLIPALLLAACGESSQAACPALGPVVLADLAAALTTPGARIGDAHYVPATPPDAGANGGQWYAVAAALAKGAYPADGVTAVWVTDADLPNDAPGGSWFATNKTTEDLAQYPMPDVVQSWALESTNDNDAEDCLAP